MGYGPDWKLYSLLVFGAAFALIIANTWRHSRKGGDTSGILLLQNFIIAVAGCGTLFWYWGFFELPVSTLAGAREPADIDCDSETQRREVRALKLCLKASDCDVTVDDSLKIVTFEEVCSTKAEAERYKDGCTIYNPLTKRDQKLTEQECHAFYDEE